MGKQVVQLLILLAVLIGGCGNEEEESPEAADTPLRPFVARTPSEYREEVHADMTHLILPMVVYYHHVGVLPTTEEGLQALIDGPDDPQLADRFEGPYIPKNMPELLIDPWGRQYVYRRTEGGNRPIDLRSLGPDGVESDDDISYAEFRRISDLIR